MDIFHPKNSFIGILYHVFTLEKCGFHQFEVEFLGYIIFGDNIYMDFRKVQTIVDWATLVFVQDVKCFLGFAKFMSMIHCTLFHDSQPSYSFDLERSTFFLWS
jgi:hypothetical protein